MRSVAGFTLVPSRVTTSPLTSTSPSSISSSLRRREATPARASSFCSLIRPSSSRGRSIRSAIGASALRRRLGRGCRHLAQLVLQVVHVGQVRRELGQLVEAGDADPLEEVAGGAVEVGACLVVLAGLLD